MLELKGGDPLTAIALAFPVQEGRLNPAPFTSLGIAIAFVCGGVSSFFLWPTDLIAIGEVKYFHYPLPRI